MSRTKPVLSQWMKDAIESYDSNKKTSSRDPSVATVSPLCEFELIRGICALTCSPRSLAVWMLYYYGEHMQLLELQCEPKHYECTDRFALDYLCSKILSKSVDLNVSIDRKAATMKKWLEAESLCGQSNEIFSLRNAGLFSFRPAVEDAYRVAQQKIAEILGEIDFKKIGERCRFGPGSDMSTFKGKTSAFNKYGNPGSCTPWIIPLFDEVFSDFRVNDYLHECQLVRGNKVFFVPKNAKIERPAAKEPRWNVWFQLGIGDLIADKIQRASGIDLQDQEPNRFGASHAHVDDCVTVDLSSASDTIAKALVLDLLPEDWSDLLFKTRSPMTFVDGKWVQYEKISSMGNGYTFPLESLIFYGFCFAAVKATAQDPSLIRVFGDDIIVPRKSYPLLKELLTAVGFEVNHSKTFVEGNFYESCGEDYFKGKNVRPIFVKKRVSSVKGLYVLINQILEYARRSANYAHADSRFASIWRRAVSFVPEALKLFGPIGQSGVIHTPFDQSTPSYVSKGHDLKKAGWEGYYFQAYVDVPLRFIGNNYLGHLFTKLRDDVDSGQEYTIRDRVRQQKKKVYVHTYRDFHWN